jgi:hypothetical protein
MREVMVRSTPSALRGSVNQISHAAISITNPGKLDGVYKDTAVLLLAHRLFHQSAQGGWGPTHAQAG